MSGLSNWNFRAQTPVQDSQLRNQIFGDSASKFRSTQPDQFSQKSFDRRMTDQSRFYNENIPSFETLEKSIRGYSSSREEWSFAKQRNTSKTTFNYSPKKLSGIKSKIGSIGSNNTSFNQRDSQSKIVPLSSSNRTQFSSFNPKVSVSKNSEVFKYNGKSGSLFDLDNKFYTGRTRGIAEVVPINQLVDIRTKIESADSQSIQTLTPGYINELVRLAQVITSSVKRLR